mmetsp:Transcript_8947/g.17508  ORF Transcript_8947/g.17508 Transcript_8947/m.17508 type:complete len:147 (-) Transcript_8947:117-557(-)
MITIIVRRSPECSFVCFDLSNRASFRSFAHGRGPWNRNLGIRRSQNPKRNVVVLLGLNLDIKRQWQDAAKTALESRCPFSTSTASLVLDYCEEISFSEATARAAKIGACAYREVSAKTGEGITSLLDAVLPGGALSLRLRGQLIYM